MITHLDGAEIIKLSKIGEYGTVTMLNGNVCNIIVRYLAICKYANDTEFHLFSCSEKLEIIDDEAWKKWTGDAPLSIYSLDCTQIRSK